jgi:hypothetical protein
MGLFDSIASGVSSLGRKIGGVAKSIGKKVVGGVKTGAKVLTRGATAVVDNVVAPIMKATGKAAKTVGETVEKVADVGKDVVESTAEAIVAVPKVLKALPGAGKKIIDRLKQGKGVDFGVASKALAEAFSGLKGKAKANSAIPAFIREMARLALGAYKKTASVDGWTRDKEISNGKTSVYTKDNQVVISHRGTDTSDSQDMSADKDIVLGSFDEDDPRVKRAKKIADKAVKKYRGKKFTQVGHSLGAVVMEELKRYAKRNIGFNAGSSPAYNSFRKAPKRIETYLIDGDGISVFNKKPKGVFKPKGSRSPHDIENFI